MSAGRWFRMYDELLDDPKVQMLPIEDRWTWVELLCVASRNEGSIYPDFTALGFTLRRSPSDARAVVERLLDGGLLDRVSGGPSGFRFVPHGWEKRQFKSDTSAERTRKYRERKRDEAVTSQVTPPDTETDTYTERAPQTPHPGGEAAPQLTLVETEPAEGMREAQQATAAYNATATKVGWPQCKTISPTRRKQILARLRDAGGLDGWQEAMERAARSRFLTTPTDKWGGPTIDFFLQQSSFLKLIEGAYDRSVAAPRPVQRVPSDLR